MKHPWCSSCCARDEASLVFKLLCEGWSILGFQVVARGMKHPWFSSCCARDKASVVFKVVVRGMKHPWFSSCCARDEASLVFKLLREGWSILGFQVVVQGMKHPWSLQSTSHIFLQRGTGTLTYIASITKRMPHYILIGHDTTWFLQKALENQVCREHKPPHFVGEMSTPIWNEWNEIESNKIHSNEVNEWLNNKWISEFLI